MCRIHFKIKFMKNKKYAVLFRFILIVQQFNCFTFKLDEPNMPKPLSYSWNSTELRSNCPESKTVDG